ESGNAYAVIESDIRGGVTRLTPVESSAVEPILESESQELWYKIIGESQTYYFHNLDVLHLKHIVGASGLKGINPIK
ncbi:phage portal protein, partial [Alkalibacillus haloalkaliphilus]|nr:phage portal protein [Alkalibacillus haloalkaliphilus]